MIENQWQSRGRGSLIERGGLFKVLCLKGVGGEGNRAMPLYTKIIVKYMLINEPHYLELKSVNSFFSTYLENKTC